MFKTCIALKFVDDDDDDDDWLWQTFWQLAAFDKQVVNMNSGWKQKQTEHLTAESDCHLFISSRNTLLYLVSAQHCVTTTKLQYNACNPLSWPYVRQRAGLARYISDKYRWYISDIFVRKYQIFSIFSIFIEFLNIFNVRHCDYVLIFSLCVLLAYDLCPQHFLSVGQLLPHCTSPQQWSVNNKSTSSNMQSTHTHTYYYLVVNFI